MKKKYSDSRLLILQFIYIKLLIVAIQKSIKRLSISDYIFFSSTINILIPFLLFIIILKSIKTSFIHLNFDLFIKTYNAVKTNYLLSTPWKNPIKRT